MSLRLLHSIALPASAKPGAFGGADLHHASGRLFVAHAANDAVDVIDTVFGVYLYSVPELRGVSAVAVGQALNEVFTADSNENKIGFFQAADRDAEKMAVGRRPTSLAWDARRGLLWVGNAGHPNNRADFSISLVDFLNATRVIATLPLPEPARGMLWDDAADALYVALDSPARILVIPGSTPSDVGAVWSVPADGVRSLVMDTQTGHLLCACEGNVIAALDVRTGNLMASGRAAGEADGMAVNPILRRLYIAEGSSGAVEVLDAGSLHVMDGIATEAGARTLYLDVRAGMLYVFCPGSQHVMVFTAA